MQISGHNKCDYCWDKGIIWAWEGLPTKTPFQPPHHQSKIETCQDCQQLLKITTPPNWSIKTLTSIEYTYKQTKQIHRQMRYHAAKLGLKLITELKPPIKIRGSIGIKIRGSIGWKHHQNTNKCNTCWDNGIIWTWTGWTPNKKDWTTETCPKCKQLTKITNYPPKPAPTASTKATIKTPGPKPPTKKKH